MKSYLSLVLMVIISSFTYSACSGEYDYEEVVKKELSSGERNNDLFLGYSFDMTQQEFFDHSWELNQQGVVTGDAQVRYKIPDLSSEATMTFYPSFKNGKIFRMPVQVSFDSWAIWNRDLYSDKLIEELLSHFEEKFGSGFFRNQYPDLNREAWVKVDGNRQIIMYRHDDMKVRVEFLDLTAE